MRILTLRIPILIMKQFNRRSAAALLLAILLLLTVLCGCAKTPDAATETSETESTTGTALTMDGAVNVRDIGGWPTEDGRHVKSGMIYRGSEIDGLFSPYCLSEKGRDYALNTLHIKSDFDLRGDTIKPLPESFLGKDVRYACFKLRSYNSIFSSTYMPEVARLFSAFADETSYPLYLHCTYGMDRTGTVCYVLEALLGMSREDLDREYRLSFETFPDNADSTDDYDRFTAYFDALEGNTYREKAQNYLLSCGVTEDELNTIINLLTE